MRQLILMVGLVVVPFACAEPVNAQESSDPSAATQVEVPEYGPDAPRWAHRGSLEQLAKRGRWLTGFGAGTLGVGVGLLVAGITTARIDVQTNQLFGDFGVVTTATWQASFGVVFIVVGTVLTPLGARRLRWTSKERKRQAGLAIGPTSLGVQGTF